MRLRCHTSHAIVLAPSAGASASLASSRSSTAAWTSPGKRPKSSTRYPSTSIRASSYGLCTAGPESRPPDRQHQPLEGVLAGWTRWGRRYRAAMMLASTTDSSVARRLGTLAIGLLLVACGVASMIRAELGVAPWDVLTTGTAEATGLDNGIAEIGRA